MAFSTTDSFQSRARAASKASAMDRRIKQILASNPGHGVERARHAAQEEADALDALERSTLKTRADAARHARAKQLQASNLELSYDRAVEIARLQLSALTAAVTGARTVYGF
jgi:hypothetical protein